MVGVTGVAHCLDHLGAAPDGQTRGAHSAGYTERRCPSQAMLRSMWTWSLNWGEITPRLVIGTCPMTPADLQRIGGEAGVSALLSQHDACLVYWGINYRAMRAHGTNLGLRMARSPMRDFDIRDQRRNLPGAVVALATLQALGHRTYVHCTAGLGRATLTVLSYLVWVEGLSPEEAIRLIHRGRPSAVPAWEAHRGCREDLVERHRSGVEQRAYALSQARPAGRPDPDADWLQAQTEVIRSVLTAIDSPADATVG